MSSTCWIWKSPKVSKSIYKSIRRSLLAISRFFFFIFLHLPSSTLTTTSCSNLPKVRHLNSPPINPATFSMTATPVSKACTTEVALPSTVTRIEMTSRMAMTQAAISASANQQLCYTWHLQSSTPRGHRDASLHSPLHQQISSTTWVVWEPSGYICGQVSGRGNSCPGYRAFHSSRNGLEQYQLLWITILAILVLSAYKLQPCLLLINQYQLASLMGGKNKNKNKNKDKNAEEPTADVAQDPKQQTEPGLQSNQQKVEDNQAQTTEHSNQDTPTEPTNMQPVQVPTQAQVQPVKEQVNVPETIVNQEPETAVQAASEPDAVVEAPTASDVDGQANVSVEQAVAEVKEEVLQNIVNVVQSLPVQEQPVEPEAQQPAKQQEESEKTQQIVEKVEDNVVAEEAPKVEQQEQLSNPVQPNNVVNQIQSQPASEPVSVPCSAPEALIQVQNSRQSFQFDRSLLNQPAPEKPAEAISVMKSYHSEASDEVPVKAQQPAQNIIHQVSSEPLPVITGAQQEHQQLTQTIVMQPHHYPQENLVHAVPQSISMPEPVLQHQPVANPLPVGQPQSVVLSEPVVQDQPIEKKLSEPLQIDYEQINKQMLKEREEQWAKIRSEQQIIDQIQQPEILPKVDPLSPEARPHVEEHLQYTNNLPIIQQVREQAHEAHLHEKKAELVQEEQKIKEKLKDTEEVRKEIKEGSPVKKIGVAAAATALCLGALVLGKADKKLAAGASIASFILAYLAQK